MHPALTDAIRAVQDGPDRRASPPLVYRDRAISGGWVVEPPEGNGRQAFIGPNACMAALEFAHKTYGCARYLSDSGAGLLRRFSAATNRPY